MQEKKSDLGFIILTHRQCHIILEAGTLVITRLSQSCNSLLRVNEMTKEAMTNHAQMTGSISDSLFVLLQKLAIHRKHDSDDVSIITDGGFISHIEGLLQYHEETPFQYPDKKLDGELYEKIKKIRQSLNIKSWSPGE